MTIKDIDTIFQGDCMKYLSNQSFFPDNSIDLIITSPPYAERRKAYYGGVHPDRYVDWFSPISKQLLRILKNRGSFILNIKEGVFKGERQTYVLELILELKKNGWLWVEEYCWYKKNSYPGKWPNRFRDNWERCLHFSKQKDFKMYQDSVKVPIGDWTKKRFQTLSEKDFMRNVSGTNERFAKNLSNWLNKKKVYPHNVLVFEKEHYFELTNLIQFSTECRNKNHPAVFPLELPTWFIKLFTRKNNVILDPFIGIGTTAIACLLLDRQFIGIENKKEYVDEAQKNIREVRKLRTK